MDHARSHGHSRCCTHAYCLPPIRRCRHPEENHFRGSMVGLCTPLPTLRPYPRGHRRTARGRCGSLLLHRKGLSPSTPCRFIRTRRILIFACGTSSNRCAAGSVAMVEDEVEARSTSDASTATTYRRNAAALMLIRCLEIRYLGPHELAARLFLSGFPSQWSAAYRPASEVSTNTSGSGRGRWVICS